MERALAQRGFARGGKLALNTRALELARAGELADLESKLSLYEQDLRDRAVQQALQFAFGGPVGQTVTSNTPGAALASGVGAGVETLTYLLALSKLLQGTPAISIPELLGSGYRG